MELIIVGCQNGDEGKGKFTDYFAGRATAVVRYQGGPHTGHTVEDENGRYRFVQVPAGVLRGIRGLLGNGCVIDPPALSEEIERLPIPTEDLDLGISWAAHVIFPYHRYQDEIMETWRGDWLATSADKGLRTGTGQLGSTKRGVGPCREDKIARIGLRMVDLVDEDLVRSRLPRLLELKRNLLERGFGVPLEDFDCYQPTDWDAKALGELYLEHGSRLSRYLCDASAWLAAARKASADIVYEGAQSVGLDVEHGTYPFCSSGYSAAGGVTVGTGSPPSTPFEVYGVVKAYTTQVGGGPLPTELDGELADYLIERGREYGTVTGRRRRVGWLDLAFVRRAVRIDGVTRICMSCLDVLAGLPTVQVATRYRVNGKELDEFPVDLRTAAAVQPVYEELPGWPELVDSGGRFPSRWDALPETARRYVEFVAGQLGVGIAAVGVGPSRGATIEVPR